MGTRSTTIVLEEDDKELVRIYRQFDGYPEGHGVDLAKLCDVKIVNGFSSKDAKQANGMGCLAAQIISGLKDGVGNVYVEPTGGEISDWCEFVYIVRGKTGETPIIECTTQTGPWPFNVQKSKRRVFKLKPKDIIEKYNKRSAA